MTLAFVAFWKKRHGCRRCIRIPGKSMCAKCKTVALQSWHKYVARRISNHLCIQCPRTPKPNQQRCPSCAEANRQNCLSYYHRKRKFVVAALKAQGICVDCHRKNVESPHRTCRKCLGDRNRSARMRQQGITVKRAYKYLGYV